MADIEALPSYWKGTIFRSRTEARWAVFFDLLRLRWVYEPEGFRLPSGTWYLPDFWLPEVGVWAEVKPSSGPTEGEVEKAWALVRGTRKPLVFLPGAPWPEPYQYLYWSEHDGVGGIDQEMVQFTYKYLVGRHDGRPRFYFLCGEDLREEPEMDRAMQLARSMDLTEPTADQSLPTGWEGVRPAADTGDLPW